MLKIDEETKKVIVKFLISAALSDHLGDIRDAEIDLFKLLGISQERLDERFYNDETPFQELQKLIKEYNLPCEDWVLEDEEE